MAVQCREAQSSPSEKQRSKQVREVVWILTKRLLEMRLLLCESAKDSMPISQSVK